MYAGIKSRTCLYNPLLFIFVLDRWASLLFFYLLCSYILIGNRVRVIISGMAPEVTNARPAGGAKQMPHPRDWQGGQMPRSRPVRGGGGWRRLGRAGIDWALLSHRTLYITDLDHEVVSGSQLTRFCVEGFKTSTRASFGNRRTRSTHYALGSDKFCRQNFEENKRLLRRAFCRQNKAFSSRIEAE